MTKVIFFFRKVILKINIQFQRLEFILDNLCLFKNLHNFFIYKIKSKSMYAEVYLFSKGNVEVKHYLLLILFKPLVYVYRGYT